MHVDSFLSEESNLLEWALGNAFNVELRAKGGGGEDTSYILDNNMFVL